MQETRLVMELIEELSVKECNGSAKVRLGTALADPEKFRNIFDQYSKGTYFEKVNLEVEEIEPEVACECGYSSKITDADMVNAPCPRCNEVTKISKGTEFEIVLPD